MHYIYAYLQIMIFRLRCVVFIDVVSNFASGRGR